MKIKISASFSVIIALLSFGILSSCNTSKKMNRDFIYFQRGLDSLGSVQPKEIVIKANDILSIRVGSRSLNQEQTRVFNMGSADSSVTTYTVNPAGNIEIPMIGALKAAGFTIAQLQTTLTDKLVTYVKDPVVSIRYY
ncbi:MAG TPA: polysaccharide biosynthesis/export family protein, partial [Segetibacter sp.]